MTGCGSDKAAKTKTASKEISAEKINNMKDSCVTLFNAGKYLIFPASANLFSEDLSFSSGKIPVEIKEGETIVKTLSQEEFKSLFEKDTE